MAEHDGSTNDASAQGRSTPPSDEISLFDVWNVLVRRRWVVFAVFALALAASAAFALTRPPMYRVSQVIEVGQVETGDIPDQSRPTTYFDPPATVATVLENIHIPAARSAAESDQTNRSPLSATVSASAVADSRLVRMMAEVPPERVDAYKKFMSRAADRLIDAHGEAAESVRQRFEDALTAA